MQLDIGKEYVVSLTTTTNPSAHNLWDGIKIIILNSSHLIARGKITEIPFSPSRPRSYRIGDEVAFYTKDLVPLTRKYVDGF